jgi:hypothetical protein
MVVVQEPGELVLAVLAEAPDPAPVALRESVLRHGPITATFQVIGASHLVGIRVDDRPWFHETLSCLPIPPQDCLHHHGFTDLADHDAALPGWGYRVQVRLRTAPAEADPTGAEAGTEAGTGAGESIDAGLVVAFPAVFGRKPVTHVAWTVGERDLSWTTLHTYPSPEGVTAVTSRSVLHLPVGATGRRRSHRGRVSHRTPPAAVSVARTTLS